MPTRVSRAGTASARPAPAVLGQDDGAEPGATDALGGPLPGHGGVRIKTSRCHRFPTRYTRADIELLAQVDEAHEALSGPATRDPGAKFFTGSDVAGDNQQIAKENRSVGAYLVCHGTSGGTSRLGQPVQ